MHSCVRSRNLKNEEAMAHIGPQCPGGGAIGDICNENILVMNKRNVGTKTILNVIQTF